jgi:hypothetical protein
MMAFREILMSAMEDGAGFDPEKVVHVTAARTERGIILSGPGQLHFYGSLCWPANTRAVLQMQPLYHHRSTISPDALSDPIDKVSKLASIPIPKLNR